MRSGQSRATAETMRYIEANLTANETILASARVHWFVYVSGVVTGLVGSVFLFLTWDLAPGKPPSAGPYLIFGVVGSWLIIVAVYKLPRAWLRVGFTEVAVTSQRVVAKFGWIRHRTVELNHNMVESITVYQGLMARVFNFGTLTIRGTGGGQTPVPTIAHPLEFRRVVTEQITRASGVEP